MAMLHVAAHGFHLPSCIGGRIGLGVSHLYGIDEAEHSFTIWWHTGSDFNKSNHALYHYECPAACRLSSIMGNDPQAQEWRQCSFVQVIIAKDDDFSTFRRQEPSVPNLGGPFSKKRPPDDTPGQPGQDDMPPRPPPPGHPGGTMRSTVKAAPELPQPILPHPSADDPMTLPMPGTGSDHDLDLKKQKHRGKKRRWQRCPC